MKISKFIKLIFALTIFSISYFFCSCNSCGTTNQNNCNNNAQDGTETGIDCGGSCSPCFPVDMDKELLIIDPVIVDSPAALSGQLSFGAIIQRLSGTLSSKDVLMSFLTSWDTPQIVNNITVQPRLNNRNEIITEWKTRDGNATISDNNWNPNFLNAPFRLLAINSRFDLTHFPSNKIGEGRLTYGLDSGNSRYTMIFEFNLEGDSELKRIASMKRWHQLSNMDQNSQEYLDTLIAIVLDFTSEPSDLSQLRTNEFLSGSRWEFREFNIESDGLFHEVTRKSSPTTELQGNPILLNYIDARGNDISNGIVDEQFSGNNILAGNTLYGSNFTWQVSGATPQQQQKLDELTFVSCVGCHGGLVSGTGFTHIKPRQQGNASQISSFLSGDIQNRIQLVTNTLILPPPTSFQIQPLMDSSAFVLRTSQVEDIKEMLHKFKDVKRTH